MTQAGQLTEIVTFQTQVQTNPDAPADYGNTVSTWVDSFTAWAEYVPMHGSETILAGRLAGHHIQMIRVRATPQSREVKADWHLTDTRTGEIYNIRDVTLSVDRTWVDCLCEMGVAA